MSMKVGGIWDTIHGSRSVHTYLQGGPDLEAGDLEAGPNLDRGLTLTVERSNWHQFLKRLPWGDRNCCNEISFQFARLYNAS